MTLAASRLQPSEPCSCRPREGRPWKPVLGYLDLERKMHDAFHTVLNTSLKYKCDLRTAAYIVAINRVASVTKLRGMYA